MLTEPAIEELQLPRAGYFEPVQSPWEDVVDSVREEYLSATQNYPWIIGFSGGKDSTVVAQAVFEALLQGPPSTRTRPVAGSAMSRTTVPPVGTVVEV